MVAATQFDGGRDLGGRARVDRFGTEDDEADRVLDAAMASERPRGARRGMFSLDRSPLARKIILFNLLAILTLVVGVLLLNPSRDSLLVQREQNLVTEALLLADIVETRLATGATLRGSNIGDGMETDLMAGIDVPRGIEVRIFDDRGRQVGMAIGSSRPVEVSGLSDGGGQTTIITSGLNAVWEAVTERFLQGEGAAPASADVAREMIAAVAPGEIAIRGYRGEAGQQFTVTAPIEKPTGAPGRIAVTTRSGEIDALARVEREQLLADLRHRAPGVDRIEPDPGLHDRQSALRPLRGSRTRAGSRRAADGAAEGAHPGPDRASRRDRAIVRRAARDGRRPL